MVPGVQPVHDNLPCVLLSAAAIAEVAKEYQAKGLAVIAISSNSTKTHPQDGPDKMAEEAKLNGFTFPYLFDETQSVAKAYKAACTPEFYVFDADLKLTYHGQFDDARPKNGKPVTGMCAALAACSDSRTMFGQRLCLHQIMLIMTYHSQIDDAGPRNDKLITSV
eukprot:GHRR01012989.1.p1 GENE.GHRR01012989.1~~GHRR01012989.1.p1  ORF type:complete len:165 (+),score=47.12 GHRR01012989.1:950-1444(+)